MKFGVKIFDEADRAKHFEGKADFLEVMAIPGRDYSFLDGYSLPIVIHALHFDYGVNDADSSLKKENKESIDFALELASRFGAEKVVLHAGNLVNENCSLQNAIDSFVCLDDRVVFENLHGESCLCGSAEECGEFVDKTGKGFCLDFNHAIYWARENGCDVDGEVFKMIELKPVHYHIGGVGSGRSAEHLSFGEGDEEVLKYLKMIPEDSWITLETSMDIESIEKDLEKVREFVG
jgi:sugar phosphate isomerase/epimerase